MPRGSQRLTRGAWEGQAEVTEAAWRRLRAPWRLPGEALGPAWETPRDHFRAKFDFKLDCLAANFFEAIFLEDFN